MELIEALKWRYATKKFSTDKVSEENVNHILEAINLTASSIGMQTYRVLVIENDELRKKLGKDSFNTQIIEASHLLVFAAFETVTEETIDNYIEFVARERNMSIDDLVDFKNAIKGGILNRTDEEHFIWSAKQAYIGLGTGLIAAANLQIDSIPMEGFDAEKFDNVLGLKERGLKSVVLLGLGYRDAGNDYMANLKKVRLPLYEFTIRIK